MNSVVNSNKKQVILNYNFFHSKMRFTCKTLAFFLQINEPFASFEISPEMRSKHRCTLSNSEAETAGKLYEY